MRIESEVIRAKSRVLEREWKTEVDDGWTVYHNDGQRLDDRYWRMDEMRPLSEQTLTDGMKVIWKGNPFDYIWNHGVIDVDNLTVESQTSIGWLRWSDKKKCWVVDSVANKAAIAAMQKFNQDEDPLLED